MLFVFEIPFTASCPEQGDDGTLLTVDWERRSVLGVTDVCTTYLAKPLFRIRLPQNVQNQTYSVHIDARDMVLESRWKGLG